MVVRGEQTSTPTIQNSLKVTNYGEIISDTDWIPYYIYRYDEQSGSFYLFYLDDPNQSILNPDAWAGILERFVDTSSAISIVGYKHSFTNLPGIENPNFSVKFFCSDTDSENESEWQQIAFVQNSNNILFLDNVKRYLKIKLEFSSESDLSNSNLLFLIQVNIEEVIPPVITDHTRSVLSRFPSWTKIYSDSLERATPEIALPESKAGLLVNSLLNEDLDNIDKLISDIDFDSFIATADTNQIAWLYVVPSVKPGFLKIYGDGIELARVSSYYELMQQSYHDNVFYYDFITQEVYSIKPFNELLIDNIQYNQIVVQNYNSFDEFGLRVGLQRLYLEPNINFKKRILDVYLNPPSVDIEGLKKTLRRELDIWRAYGSTPDSNYVGATPEIIEISDFESNNGKYFSNDGTPSLAFYDLVENMNIRFPANIGYGKWDETYWDYAGLKQEGVSSIPQVSDVDNIDGANYQAGIGDFDDLKIILEPISKDIENYSFLLKAKGIKSDSTQNAYEPIKIAYDTYVSYYEQYSDNQYATVNYEIYLKLNSHGNIPQNSVYKAEVTDYVRNLEQQTHSASPEYLLKQVFTPSLFSNSDLLFLNSGGTPYYNIIEPSATESYVLSQIPLDVVQQATVNFISSKNSSGAIGDFAWINLENATPNGYAQNSNKTITKLLTEKTPEALNLKVSSKIWDGQKTRVSETDRVRSSVFGNLLNASGDISQTNKIELQASEIKKSFLLPNGAQPIYVHIQNIVVDPYSVDLSTGVNSGYGGVSRNRDNQLDYLIPSSPNIIAGFVNPGFATPNLHENYISTSGSTVSYYFTNLKFPYSATPDSIFIESASSAYYPFNQKVWDNFEALSNDEFDFYISQNGVEKGPETSNADDLNNQKGDLIGTYNLYRSDFGLQAYDSSEDLIIKSLEIINENDNVIIWQENESDSSNLLNLNSYDEDSGKYIVKDIKIRAKYDLVSEQNISPSIRSGWYYQNGEERFVYARPEQHIYNNLNEIYLEEIARGGSPIIVDVQGSGSTPVQYRQVSFYDESTPYQFSHSNFEHIVAQSTTAIYLGYYDVYDVSITDSFTGELIGSGIQSFTNQISYTDIFGFSGFVIGRSYKVSYKVRNAFYVDNNDYDSVTDEYRTRIYLLSTPNGSYAATVTYESALYDRDYEIPNMKLNPLYAPIDEGYIFLSHEDYASDSIDLIISPKRILADGVDYAILSVFSKDINGNPKPNQTFHITGADVYATPEYITTNDDGYVNSKVSYVGSPILVPTNLNFSVYGLNSSTPNSHINSSSGLINETVSLNLQPTITPNFKLIAETSKKIMVADGLDSMQVYGLAQPNKNVYWRKSRNLHDALTMAYSVSSNSPEQNHVSGMVQSDSSGKFVIEYFISQPDATPGYWFVVVDTENASTPNANPVTIAGDILYWYEKYDANQTNTEEPYYIPLLNESSDYSMYDEDPVFKADQITGDIFYDIESATPWLVPKWYPIKRFTQYQMGLLGQTPESVTSLSNLRPDYEEE